MEIFTLKIVKLTDSGEKMSEGREIFYTMFLTKEERKRAFMKENGLFMDKSIEQKERNMCQYKQLVQCRDESFLP
jgi:hypothetical protein